ncbi:MAG: hypothetical protein R6X32_04940 [Chloroflexota bacterium]|jgi:hypothetical protein
MLKVAGSASLSFVFPARRAIAYLFYNNMERLVSYLPHIEMLYEENEFEYRMLYQSTELGTYHLSIFCDVRMELPPGNRVIRLVSIENLPPVETKLTVNSTTGRGFFSSEAHFHDEGPDQTRIDFKMRLGANMPRPLGMRFMPGRVVDNIANGITNRRLREITEGFLELSLADFPTWQERLEVQLLQK